MTFRLSYLERTCQIVFIAQDILNTGKREIKYAEALEKVRIYFFIQLVCFSMPLNRSIRVSWLRGNTVYGSHSQRDHRLYQFRWQWYKSFRGINHPAGYATPYTSLVLCSSYIWYKVRLFFFVFERIYAQISHSRLLAKLSNGKIRAKATDWPAFLYDRANADPDDVEEGLFTGDMYYYFCFVDLCSSFFYCCFRYPVWFFLARVPCSLASSARTRLPSVTLGRLVRQLLDVLAAPFRFCLI